MDGYKKNSYESSFIFRNMALAARALAAFNVLPHLVTSKGVPPGPLEVDVSVHKILLGPTFFLNIKQFLYYNYTALHLYCKQELYGCILGHFHTRFSLVKFFYRCNGDFPIETF